MPKSANKNLPTCTAHRIAYLSTAYPEVSHTFIRRELHELESRGHNVLRLSIRKPTSNLVDAQDIRERGHTTYLLANPASVLISTIISAIAKPIRFACALRTTMRLHCKNDRGLMRHLAYLAEACLLHKILIEHRTQHLHVHFGTNVASVALLARQLGGPPYSITIHGPDELDAPKGLSLDEKIRGSAFTVAISDFCAGQLRRWTPPEQWSKIAVVHCTIDQTFVENTIPICSNSKTLVCVGRLSAQKGQLLLLEAAQQLIAGGLDFRLLLVGDGEMRESIEATIRNKNLEGTVSITGWMSGEGVREALRDSRGLVLPSYAEGLPVVIMEAFALARPVITTHVAAIPELVQHGKNGWLVPAGQVNPLMDAMRELLITPSTELDKLGQHGRERVLTDHTPKLQANKLEKLMKRSIAGMT